MPTSLAQASEWIAQQVGIPPGVQEQLLILGASVLFLMLLRALLLRVAFRRVKDVKQRYQWKRLTLYVATLVLVLVAMRLWLGVVPSLSTYLGLLSAGLAIALQAPLVNLAGWVFLLWRRPFVVGDRIEIGSVKGDVIDLRLFQFSLLELGNWVNAEQSTGRVVHVPNAKVFSDVVANYTRGFQFIWNELPVLVTFESDWRAAKEILDQIAREHAMHLTEEAAERVRQAAQKYMIFFQKLTPVVYTSVEDSGIMLSIRYLCRPHQRRNSTQELWESILDAFAERDDIDFAYPTQRLYLPGDARPTVREPGR